MKLIYLYQYFKFPDETGGTRSYDLASSFLKKGIMVTVVSSTSDLKYKSNKRWTVIDKEGLNIHYIYLPYGNHLSYFKRIVVFFKFIWFATFRLLKLKGDVVLATSTPLTIGIPALIKKWFGKTPFIFEVRDVWPEAVIAIGAIKNKWLQKLLYRLEKLIYKNAIAIVPLSTDMQKSIVFRYPQFKNKTNIVIENIAEINRFQSNSKAVDLKDISFIHAHTWYSDGGVAYELSKKYNIPYIVAIRNTDLNIFQEKLKYVRPYGKRIIDKAQKVILVSASYRERVLSQKSLKAIVPQLLKKIVTIPNGVDSFWLNNTFAKTLRSKEQYNILYIGNFNSGKNVLNLIKAIKNCNKHNIICRLQLVGGGGSDEEQILRQISNFPEMFVFHGKIYDKKRLKNIYQSADIFAMPSRNETFGLVYVEAMLQSLPILYTQNEGIDGFYAENIGEKVSRHADVEEIEHSLLRIMNNYSSYRIPLEKLIHNHNWKNIALDYQNVYSSLSNINN